MKCVWTACSMTLKGMYQKIFGIRRHRLKALRTQVFTSNISIVSEPDDQPDVFPKIQVYVYKHSGLSIWWDDTLFVEPSKLTLMRWSEKKSANRLFHLLALWRVRWFVRTISHQIQSDTQRKITYCQYAKGSKNYNKKLFTRVYSHKRQNCTLGFISICQYLSISSEIGSF